MATKVHGTDWPLLSLSLAGSFSEDAKHPFANTTTSASSIALALYGVMWAYDGW